VVGSRSSSGSTTHGTGWWSREWRKASIGALERVWAGTVGALIGLLLGEVMLIVTRERRGEGEGDWRCWTVATGVIELRRGGGGLFTNRSEITVQERDVYNKYIYIFLHPW
jgi:hypothetical protein